MTRAAVALKASENKHFKHEFAIERRPGGPPWKLRMWKVSRRLRSLRTTSCLMLSRT
jgi:hypothetical protein